MTEQAFDKSRIKQQVLAVERRLWKPEPEFFARHLAREAVIILPPPAGILNRSEIEETLLNDVKWEKILFDREEVIPFSDSEILLIYSVTAWRGDDRGAYSAFASSIYRRSRNIWQLMFHQRTEEV